MGGMDAVIEGTILTNLPCAFDDHGAEMNRENWLLTSPTMLPAMMEFCISKLIPVPLRHIRENSNSKYK
jgi:hypothetical protein